MRLKDRVAIVVGAGQSPGEGMGNGRATALTFAREGAKVLCVDHNLKSAQETVEMIGANQGTAMAFKADVTKEADIKAMVADAHSRWGRIDILHNNVGVSLSGGDAELRDISEEAFRPLERELTELFTKAGDSDNDEVDSIANLALLGGGDNSALSNSVFEVKRREILRLDREGSYIPVSTRNVFLKYYTGAEGQQMHFWGQHDREGYIAALKDVLDPYLLEEDVSS